MKNKFNRIEGNKTWQQREHPTHKNTSGGRRILTLKQTDTGQLVTYRARYVAKKFQ